MRLSRAFMVADNAIISTGYDGASIAVPGRQAAEDYLPPFPEE